jgi:hypothetical protein
MSSSVEKIDPMAASALQTARLEVHLRIETALRADPQRTNWQLARELDMKRAVIARVRAMLEAQGQIPVRPSFFRVVR